MRRHKLHAVVFAGAGWPRPLGIHALRSSGFRGLVCYALLMVCLFPCTKWHVSLARSPMEAFGKLGDRSSGLQKVKPIELRSHLSLSLCEDVMDAVLWGQSFDSVARHASIC